MKKIITLFILSFLIFTNFVNAETSTTTTGFIPGSIWYSKDQIVEGDTVNIYTAVWNSGSSALSAKVEFYDKNVMLGSRDIVIPSLQLKETSVSWKVTSGDHSISAKITSPSVTVNGKKQSVVLSQNATESYHKFIPVLLSTTDGKPATSSDLLKSQIDKAASSVNDILPDSISTPVSKKVSIVDNFRSSTFDKISTSRAETKDRVDEFKKLDATSLDTKTIESNKKLGVEDATERPIAYLKLFFLSVLSFIFGSKIVFYLLIVFVLFLIIRAIYRKIRNR